METLIKIIFSTALALVICYAVFRSPGINYCIPKSDYCRPVKSGEEYRLYEQVQKYFDARGYKLTAVACHLESRQCNARVENITVLLKCEKECDALAQVCMKTDDYPKCRALDWTIKR